MRAIAFSIMGSLLIGGTPALAQEHVGVSRQAQTVAASIPIPAPPNQDATCGPAPTPADLNYAVGQIRLRFPDKTASFDNNLANAYRNRCPRNAAAAYLIHLVANNQFRFVK
jgi:hypothetical protein